MFNYFFPSIEGITKKLDRMVQKLHAHADAMHSKADKHAELSQHHETRSVSVRGEAWRARYVAHKIGDLLK